MEYMSKFYKDKTITEIKVGVIFIISIFILVFGYFWLMDYYNQNKFQLVSLELPNANGIDIGDPVLIYGIKKGRVKKISLQENGVLMQIAVEINFPLSKDTSFLINEANLMGEMQIEIVPGKSKENIDLNQIQQAKNVKGISELISKIMDISDKIDNFLSFLSENKGIINDMKRISENSIQLTENINSIIKINEPDLRLIVKNFRAITTDLDQIIVSNRNRLTDSMISIDETLKVINNNVDEFESLLKNLNKFTKKLNREEGSISQLISDKELYYKLVKSTTTLDSLLHDIQKSPKKYFKFSVF